MFRWFAVHIKKRLFNQLFFKKYFLITYKLKLKMKNYSASYQTNKCVISEAMFKAENKKEATRLAQFHKRHTPEITKAGKGVKTYVYYHSKIK